MMRMGSLPSLALAAVQSARNAKSLSRQRGRNRKALERRASALATGRVAPARSAFLRSVRESLPPGAPGRNAATSPEALVSGLDRAATLAAEEFDRGIDRHAPGGGLCRVLGFLSLALCVGLAAGPVLAVYREFLQAWWIAFGSEAGSGWERFPVPSAGMVFATALLVFAPVLLLAMVALAASVSAARVRDCSKSILANTNETLAGAFREGVVRVESNDSLRDAVGVLLREAGPAAPRADG